MVGAVHAVVGAEGAIPMIQVVPGAEALERGRPPVESIPDRTRDDYQEPKADEQRGEAAIPTTLVAFTAVLRPRLDP